ncbi:import inner membrane translocase subunit tim22 [Anaeramoeba flamelloides]|uniref:Mitochondrial import inner membrane translocase subunit TIM22 n=1 Tax=Anaeramoeba flamelloides TaxID=1746091 RepID=A0ABQ8Z6X2_9EUKA|nr:import inner membrane translocase subunit tim22 [Anaeramoeba flamelloides]
MDSNDLSILSKSKRSQEFRESIPFVSVTSGLSSFGYGFIFGSFMGAHEAIMLEDVTRKQRLNKGMKLVAQNGWENGKNLGLSSFIYSLVDTSLQKWRAKDDRINKAIAGCLCGALPKYKEGPKQMAKSCLMVGSFYVGLDLLSSLID